MSDPIPEIRDRVREFRRVPAGELQANPRNWRTHPEGQRKALEGVLRAVGFADAVLARELPDGTLELIDGHLRAEELPADYPVPVLVLDVTEAEADVILATHDPLAALANHNSDALEGLLAEIRADDDSLRDLLANIAEDYGVLPPAEEEQVERARLDITATITCPSCGNAFTR